MTRKERKKAADAKRKKIASAMASFFDDVVVLGLNKGYPKKDIVEATYSNFESIKEEMIKIHPQDAHLIRSATPEAKKIVKSIYELYEIATDHWVVAEGRLD